jgi:hypothetical protein
MTRIQAALARANWHYRGTDASGDCAALRHCEQRNRPTHRDGSREPERKWRLRPLLLIGRPVSRPGFWSATKITGEDTLVRTNAIRSAALAIYPKAAAASETTKRSCRRRP